MHVVVDHQHRAVAEQPAQHRVRFAGVKDAGTPANTFLISAGSSRYTSVPIVAIRIVNTLPYRRLHAEMKRGQ